MYIRMYIRMTQCVHITPFKRICRGATIILIIKIIIFIIITRKCYSVGRVKVAACGIVQRSEFYFILNLTFNFNESVTFAC